MAQMCTAVRIIIYYSTHAACILTKILPHILSHPLTPTALSKQSREMLKGATARCQNRTVAFSITYLYRFLREEP